MNAANPGWTNASAARGFETYFLSDARTDDERRVEALENEAVKYEAEDGLEPGDAMSFILNDMKQNEYLRESSDLAALIQASMGRVHPGKSRGVKQAGFRVLVRAYMPAVLVELGFGSSPEEARYLNSSSGQQALATAIADASVQYLDRLARKSREGAAAQ